MTAPWVIVGAGSAGCVAAARLSEDPDRSVVLLEAGPNLAEAAIPSEINGSDFLAALTVPDRTFADLSATRTTGGMTTPYARGRGVGGSSLVNAMVALRGDRDRYRSWGWQDVDAAWSRVALSVELPESDELGAVDRALLGAAPDAHPVELTRRGRRRVTSAEAYLWPVGQRQNLEVRADSAVDRVVVDGRRATGVQLMSGETVAAERVILAAGAIHTPAILLRSDIDTPGVGEGLQDHPSAALTLDLRHGAHGRVGDLVVGSVCRRGGIQFLPMNHVGANAPGLGVLLVALLTPRSRAGSVRLDSDDPRRDPTVDFALLEDRADMDDLVAGVRTAVELLRAPAFRDVVAATYVDTAGTQLAALADDESIRRWLASAVGDYVHASSSCAMGSVVDTEGAVIGYEEIYVCDASVFPGIPDANTHLPTTMLAERLCARWSAP
jgi:choline dehydrogenase-like flavoprotein